MKTTLPHGAIIKFRSRGTEDLYAVHIGPGGDAGYTGVGRHLKAGETIHKGVWKGDSFEVRRSYQLKKDCDWVPVAPKMQDFTPADVERQRKAAGGMADMFNAFGGGGKFPIFLDVIVKGGHRVVLMAGQNASVAGFGWQYTAGPKVPKNIGEMSAEDVIAFAESVVDDYHQNMPKLLGQCMTCHPPFHNIERK